ICALMSARANHTHLPFARLFGHRWLLQYAHGVSVLSFWFSRFLNELNLGKLSQTVIVHVNAPHDRPRFLLSHLIGNPASFPRTKAPMRRVISVWHRDYWAKCSGDLLPPSPPAEKATARQDQTE